MIWCEYFAERAPQRERASASHWLQIWRDGPGTFKLNNMITNVGANIDKEQFTQPYCLKLAVAAQKALEKRQCTAHQRSSILLLERGVGRISLAS